MKDLYVQCYIACLIGNVIHLAIAYLKGTQDRRSAGLQVNGLWEFIKLERATIIADFFASMGLVYAADEWLNNPYVLGKIKTAFILVGFTGSYLLLWATSRSKAKFRDDVKANKPE